MKGSFPDFVKGYKVNGEYRGDDIIMPNYNMFTQDNPFTEPHKLTDFAICNEGNNTASTVVDTLLAYPIYIFKNIFCRSIRLRINSGIAASSFRFGLYTDNGNGYPDKLLESTDQGTISSVATGNVTIEINRQIKRGQYWIVVNANAIVGLGGHNGSLSSNILGYNPTPTAGNARCNKNWTYSFTYADMPPVFPLGASLNTAALIGIWIGFECWFLCESNSKSEIPTRLNTVINGNPYNIGDELKLLHDQNFRVKDSSMYIDPRVTDSTLVNNVGFTADVMRLEAIAIWKDITIDQYALEVTAAAVGSAIQVMIYEAEKKTRNEDASILTNSLYPFKPITNSYGSVATTSTGVKTIDIPRIKLYAHKYYMIATITTGGTLGFYSSSEGNSLLNGHQSNVIDGRGKSLAISSTTSFPSKIVEERPYTNAGTPLIVFRSV